MIILLIATSYLVGGLPFAFLLTRRWGGTDVRYSGSGNLGTANVLRTSGPLVALAVLCLDLTKGFSTVWLARMLGADMGAQGAVAAAVVVGQVFPVWLRFRGGKGVATACGAFAFLAPMATFVSVVNFVLLVWLARFVSLGSIVAAVLLPVITYLESPQISLTMSTLGVAILVLSRHTENVKRLLNGTELRLGERVP